MLGQPHNLLKSMPLKQFEVKSFCLFINYKKCAEIVIKKTDLTIVHQAPTN
jgi:hypothetical protein